MPEGMAYNPISFLSFLDSNVKPAIEFENEGKNGC
jgi:hypothetical protein